MLPEMRVKTEEEKTNETRMTGSVLTQGPNTENGWSLPNTPCIEHTANRNRISALFIYHYYGVVSRFKKRGLTPQISHMFSIVILVILSRGVVLQCLGPTSYVVQVADRTMHVHVDHLSINQCSFPFKRSRVLTVHVFVGSLARKRKKLTNSSPRSKTRSLSPW